MLIMFYFFISFITLLMLGLKEEHYWYLGELVDKDKSGIKGLKPNHEQKLGAKIPNYTKRNQNMLYS